MFYIKKNYMKAIGIVAVVFLLAAQGCKKGFLVVPTQGKQPTVNQALFTSEANATAAINAIYANLREWRQTAFAPIAVESMGSDEAEKGSHAGDSEFMTDFDTFKQTSTEGQISDFWNGQYASISLCNQAVDSIPGINMDASLKARYVAEAKFVRAYGYFRLVRAFGGVPLRLHYPKSPSDFNLPRASEAQIWAQIEQDLTDAASVLPQSYGAADVGRATKGAALALHAKVAMYQNKWPDVLSYTNAVMGLGYSLFPNFEQSFRIANENNSEEIFEIQCPSIPNDGTADNSQYSQVQGARTEPNGGWGFNVPTQVLADAFETGDPRRSATILFTGATTPEGDVIPPPTSDAPSFGYNGKSYVPFNVPYYSNHGEAQDVRVIRYADVLLMNAEAANNTGNTTQALASLELVRARARGSNNSILPKVTTTDKTALQAAIWHERQVELAMEFDRFYDVVRQGRGKEVFGAKGFVVGKSEHQPLPQNEIDLSAGMLTQNPGY